MSRCHSARRHRETRSSFKKKPDTSPRISLAPRLCLSAVARLAGQWESMHVGAPGKTENIDGKSVEDHRHCECRRYARLLRLLSNRVCAGLHPEGVATNLCTIGGDPDLRRSR